MLNQQQKSKQSNRNKWKDRGGQRQATCQLVELPRDIPDWDQRKPQGQSRYLSADLTRLNEGCPRGGGVSEKSGTRGPARSPILPRACSRRIKWTGADSARSWSELHVDAAAAPAPAPVTGIHTPWSLLRMPSLLSGACRVPQRSEPNVGCVGPSRLRDAPHPREGV